MNAMTRNLPNVDHWSIDPGDVEALMSLYDATPVADISENWQAVCFDQLDVVSKANIVAKERLNCSDAEAPERVQAIEITLPEVMQCFKTLVHFDWVQKLGAELIADGVLNIPYDEFWITSWPLDEPYERGRATGLIHAFIRWWPVRCGYDVLSGAGGKYNRGYYSAMLPLYRGVILKITYDDMDKVLEHDNIGGIVTALRKYGAQK